MARRMKPSPCAICIVYPMCKNPCDAFRKYMRRVSLFRRDKYAVEIYIRSAPTRSTYSTGPR